MFDRTLSALLLFWIAAYLIWPFLGSIYLWLITEGVF